MLNALDALHYPHNNLRGDTFNCYPCSTDETVEPERVTDWVTAQTMRARAQSDWSAPRKRFLRPLRRRLSEQGERKRPKKTLF